MQGVQVSSLVRELRSHVLTQQKKKKKDRKEKMRKGQSGWTTDTSVGSQEIRQDMSKGQALKGVVKLYEDGLHFASTRENSMGLYELPLAAVTNHHKLRA